MEKILILIILISFTEAVVLPSVPIHLQACYRSGGPQLRAPRRLDVFLSLLRKIELSTSLDARMLGAALLRNLRLDGIEESSHPVETEFLLPFRASGFQFHKYKLFMDLFLPSENLLNVDENLTLTEKCLLHRMLSSTVRRWERGDEDSLCPLSAQQRQHMTTQSQTRINSRCPIEDGVIQTPWGTVSPGTLIAAMASGLEAQRVTVMDILNADEFAEDVAEPLVVAAKQEWYQDIETLGPMQRDTEPADISNIWVATLAGDLAEVVVNQGPRVGPSAHRMVVSSNNRWNDTLLPRTYFLLPQNSTVIDWQFTNAEILAGIDGFIISNYVASWMEQRRTLRMSQIIDMYYSDAGVSFDPQVRACNRQAMFSSLFNSSQLLTEAHRFAHILSLKQITVYIPLIEMERMAEAAVTAFMNNVVTLLRDNHVDCHRNNDKVPVMDLILATDGSWREYDIEQFISWIGGALEVNLQRSTLALLNSNTGQWIVPASNNLTAVYEHIGNYTQQWPNRLNLPTVISSTIQHSLNKTLLEAATNASAGPSTVVLVISPSDQPSTTEMDRARDLMATLRSSYFDVYFAYVSQDLTEFKNINNEYFDYSELFIHTPSILVQDVINAVDAYIVKTHIPARIIGEHCSFNGTTFSQIEYEDFVLPGKDQRYRIHPFYLSQQQLVSVQFRNFGQGQILVCMWHGDDTSRKCQTLNDQSIHIFNLTNPCPSPGFCLPARFQVTATTSTNLCAHNDCRLPNQVGYYLRQNGLRCLPLRSSALIVTSYWLVGFPIMISLFTLKINNIS